jgi:TP901 family phage tail tape measure protein
MSTVLEELVVKLRSDPSDYQRSTKKFVDDTIRSMNRITATVAVASKAATSGWDKAFKTASAANDKYVRMLQANEAKVASNYVREHLRAIDQKAAADAKASAKELALAQSRDQKIAQAHLQSTLRRIDQEKAAIEKANAAEIRAAQRRDALIARNHVKEQEKARKTAGFFNVPQGAPITGRSLLGSAAGIGGRVLGTGLRYGRNLALGAAGIAAASVNEFAQFDDSINRAVSVAGGASNELRRLLGDTAKEIASKSITSARDVSKSYLELTQAGFSLRDSLSAVVPVQRFAVAGAMSMSRAVEVLVQSTYALGERGPAAMQRVADVITKSANISTTSIEEMAKAISNKAGAAARMLGKDVTELSAVLAAYANAGVRGELAGEKVFQVWRDLQTGAIKQAEAWRQLGLSAYDANGKMLSTAAIVEQLERRFTGLSDQQRKQVLLAIGISDRSQAATLQLLGLSGAIRDYEAQLKVANGETDRLAKSIEGSLLSSLTNTWQNVRVLAIEIGEKLAPFARIAGRYVTELAQSLAAMLRNVNDSNAFKIFTSELSKAGKVAGAVLGEIISYTQDTFAPQLYSAAKVAGKEFSKGFWEGFTGSGRDWHKELKDAQAKITRLENWKPISGEAANMRQKLLDSARRQEANAKAEIAKGAPAAGTPLVDRITGIMQREYGGVPRSAPRVPGYPGLSPGYDSVTRAGVPTEVKRPKVPSGNLGELVGESVDDVLHGLSKEGKAAEKEADKIKAANDRAAAKIKAANDRAAAKIKDGIRTPLQKVNELILEATELAKKGLLSAAELQKYREKLYETLEPKARRGRGAGGGGSGAGSESDDGVQVPGAIDSRSAGFGRINGNAGYADNYIVGEMARSGLERLGAMSPSARREALRAQQAAKREAYQVKMGRRKNEVAPEDREADRRAKIAGYTGIAGARRSVENALASSSPGRVVRPIGPGENKALQDYQTQVANMSAASSRYAQSAFASGEFGQHFEEQKAARDNMAQAPQEGRRSYPAGQRSDPSYKAAGAGSGEESKSRTEMLEATRKLTEALTKNTEATEKNESNFAPANL